MNEMAEKLKNHKSKLFFLGFYLSSMFLVALITYIQVSKKYEEVDNKTLLYLGKEVVKNIKQLDGVVEKLKEIEDLVGIEYEEEQMDIEQRLEYIKAKTSLSLIKPRIKDSIPEGNPLEEIYITSEYGFRFHPILKKKKFHKGIDLRAAVNTKVYATAPGVVRYVQHSNKGYGNAIIIQHNMGFETVYAHLNKIKVKNGDIVKKGDIIALTGNTGRSNGPHLHYETRFGGQSIVPVVKN